jgi:hypothetical protein
MYTWSLTQENAMFNQKNQEINLYKYTHSGEPQVLMHFALCERFNVQIIHKAKGSPEDIMRLLTTVHRILSEDEQDRISEEGGFLFINPCSRDFLGVKPVPVLKSKKKEFINQLSEIIRG